jgi:hypothetical protein
LSGQAAAGAAGPTASRAAGAAGAAHAAIPPVPAAGAAAAAAGKPGGVGVAARLSVESGAARATGCDSGPACTTVGQRGRGGESGRARYDANRRSD